MSPTIKRAVELFDTAAQEYAFRGTHSGSPRYDEVCKYYHEAKAYLIAQIEKAVLRAYKSGERDGQSRADVRPGFGDMGG